MDRTYKHLAGLAGQQEALNEFMAEFADRLTVLKKRLEKGRLKVALDF